MKKINLTFNACSNLSKARPGDVLQIKFGGEVITVTYGKDKFWRDSYGSIYGFPDPDKYADPVIRCGVYPLTLPEGHPLNDACKAHDYMYSCPAYQANHTRKEADEILKDHVKLVGRGHWYGALAWPFYAIVRLFGKPFWEGKK